MSETNPEHDGIESPPSVDVPSSDAASEESPSLMDLPQAASDTAYKVLARKYRPTNFADLIGQEAMVQTLHNAFETGRIAHAFMLTGVRGVGKTTTARILARALNYATDSDDAPSMAFDAMGNHCEQIMDGRHVDVIEMDAASRTGIEHIREIIENVRYLPSVARYKVYIIDEVHMLSTAAFNGLLKTLEEPPPHVKFIFATTEIRKVPVTVLSRCQRFDLRRLTEIDTLTLLNKVCSAENMTLHADALALIARAAEGSARDALSLLDRAFAYGGGDMASITGDVMRSILGLADRLQIFDLFEAVMRGDIAAALDAFAAQYEDGAEPVSIMADLAELAYWLTRLKYVARAGDDVTIPEAQRVRGKEIAETISVRFLGRVWQVLLKGHQEVQMAANPRAAGEMVLVRLAHLSDLPTPEELVRAYTKENLDSTPAPPPAPPRAPAPAHVSEKAAEKTETAQDSSPSPPAPPAPVSPPAPPAPEARTQAQELAQAREDPLIAKGIDVFADAEITSIKAHPAASPAEDDALPAAQSGGKGG